ncbi:MAG TPA: tRNA (adenosine(37)-N6)-threonylcarbamoyltransferase complex dimerization subunit type 1 TsaB [Anaerolineae bacterium]|nr:tRNA (adenosine(37)-N6)-threonylcarbamoyltransferase complex dimerization subunit type 1 TsaB [Anaerolineae bacterium]
MLLAIDTATRVPSLALYDGERVVAEETWHSANGHTVELVPSIVRMLKRQRISPSQLQGIAVALGPGSFTGLRIGLSVAKGLALTLAIPLIGIPTLDALIYAQARRRGPVCAVLQAGRGRICVGFYRRRRGQWQRQGDYCLTTLEELCASIETPTLFCGEIDTQAAELLRERLGEKAKLVSPAASLRRAGYLAELGWQRLERGKVDDPASLSPIYLRHPPIK